MEMGEGEGKGRWEREWFVMGILGGLEMGRMVGCEYWMCVW